MSSKLTEPTRVIIPVSKAIERTTNWRNFLKKNLEEQESWKIPKAVYISKEDILDLAAACHADKSIAGVRAYFSLTVPEEEKFRNEIKFVMVLVREEEGMPAGKDVIYLPGGSSDDDSSVYDFTRPCPDFCDTTSPLFNGDQ
ncbi:hypothetical protein ABDD95_22375 [Mucilaginibacter sp. PAMB04274]|uniref:hypothetical protein n=1 Tax=Mucilaginibacter sp. PAMB04274 TaxID=3138568 RepID=UPI0031F6EC95